MSYGLEFRNNGGARVISELTKNMQYIGLATNTQNVISAPAFGGGQFPALRNCMLHYFTIYSETRPMVFIKGSTGAFYSIAQMSQSGPNWEFIIVSYPTSTPTVLCFAPIPAGAGLANPGGFGVAVYDAAGNVVFDADRKHLDPAFFGVVNTPSCSPADQANGTCSGSSAFGTGISVSDPAFFFAGQGRASVPAGNGLNNIHTLNLAAGGVAGTVAWHSYKHFQGLGQQYREAGVAPTTLIIIDAARYL